MRFLRHVLNMLPAIGGLVITLAAGLGIYVAIWGWARFKLDFWPLDSSRVGPNLCASIFLLVLLIAHNEFVVMERARQMHETHRQLLKDEIGELLHPTEEAEANIADQIEADFRQAVLDRLDETTPGGIGTIAAKLTELTPKSRR